MNRTHLKFIACVTMLIDHIGFILFPNVMWLRYIGRLSMPLFAYFIAEGARYTRNKLRYFLQIFVLGLLCQSAYLIEQLWNGGRIWSYYFNILLTFSVSLLLCFAYLFWEKMSEQNNRLYSTLAGALFVSAVLGAVLLTEWMKEFEIRSYYEYELAFDYGIRGILLPLAAVIGKDKDHRVVLFSAGIVLFCLASVRYIPFVWVALLDIPLLFLYNGKKGKHDFKYGFYLFYPIHLAILYLLSAFL